MVFFRSDTEEEDVETPDDEDATLADDVLDEVEGDAEEDGVVEGFGLVEDTKDDDEEDDEEDKEKEDDDEGNTSLEEDAEDVDYDTFDDIDEM